MEVAKSISDVRQQVADQYLVVAYLAKALSSVHKQIEPVIRNGHIDQLLPMIGERSARLMNQLGDMLNEIDAATEKDSWTDPIFEKARVMFSEWSANNVR